MAVRAGWESGRWLGAAYGVNMARRSPERLRGGPEIERVFAQGRVVTRPLLVVRFRRRAEGPTRVAVAVGRRVGGAVVRNRLRRRWREAIRLGPALRSGWDIVVVVRARSVDAGWSMLRDAWRQVVHSVSLTEVRDDGQR